MPRRTLSYPHDHRMIGRPRLGEGVPSGSGMVLLHASISAVLGGKDEKSWTAVSTIQLGDIDVKCQAGKGESGPRLGLSALRV
jgi:hypothetical protein